MSVGTGTAIAIGLTGASVAGDIYAANKAGQAAQQQTAAGQQALGLQQQIYNQSQQNLAPYLALGGGAAASLRNLMGLTDTSVPAGGARLPNGSIATGPGYAVNPVTGGATVTDLGTSIIAPGRMGIIGQTPQVFPNAGGPLGGAAGGATRPVRTPDGRVVAVPSELYQEALARGGTAV